MAVGAPLGDHGAGAVELYDGVPPADAELTTYTFGQLILPPGASLDSFQDPAQAGGDEFGAAIASIGNDLVVGAPGAHGGAGAVYVFDADPLSPTFGQLLATINDPGSTGSGGFGSALAADGTEIAVGAPLDNSGAGQAYVFAVPSTSTFSDTLSYSVNDPNNAASDAFGASLAYGSAPIYGGYQLIVGSPGYTPRPLDRLRRRLRLRDSSKSQIGTIDQPGPVVWRLRHVGGGVRVERGGRLAAGRHRRQRRGVPVRWLRRQACDVHRPGRRGRRVRHVGGVQRHPGPDRGAGSVARRRRLGGRLPLQRWHAG